MPRSAGICGSAPTESWVPGSCCSAVLTASRRRRRWPHGRRHVAPGDRRLAGRANHRARRPESLTPDEAGQACRDRGWPVEEDRDGRLWLVTGTAIDALEVPRVAGMVALAWWLYTRGVPDEIRGLPALPDPAAALAVIAVGPRCYFLARSGACPWTRPDPGSVGTVGTGAVRWHAGCGRVLAPPSPLADGERAEWVHIPAPDGMLASPMALLHVLAQAVAATRDVGSMLLAGGVRVVPATERSGPGRVIARLFRAGPLCPRIDVPSANS